MLGRLLAGRLVAGPRAADGLRVAAELVAAGNPVALEHRPAAGNDAVADLTALLAAVPSAGPLTDCELTLSVDRLADPRTAAADVAAAGLSVALKGRARHVDALLDDLPAARVVVATGDRDAADRCRALAGRRVRLRAGRGAAARLSFVRCLDVLLAGDGEPAIATADLRLIAITGERAAWHGRASDSWEHVMPWGIRTAVQQRLTASGSRVRIAVPSGCGAVAALPGGLR